MSEEHSAETGDAVPDTLVINCEAQLDISSATELHQHLLQALEKRHHVKIEAAEVNRIDASILQLFYAYLREARAAGLDFEWSSFSDAVSASADLLGLAQELGLAEAP